MSAQDESWEQPKAKGWRTKKKPPADSSPANSKPQQEKRLHNERPKRIVQGLNVEKLAEEFQGLEKKWARTECCTHVQKIMRKRRWDIDSAVCIGIGSFSVDWEHRYRSLWQLVLFMAVVGQLPGDVRLYAQEPAFTPLDIEFLRHLNITVLDTGIEGQISASTFIFAPFVDWFILLPIFLKDKDPELYIGNEILQDYTQYAGSAEKQGVLPICHQVGKQFSKGRDRVWLHSFELHGNALNGLMAYWKQDEEDD